MITDKEMQKALETVKEYCHERDCEDCGYCGFCENFLESDDPVCPSFWTIEHDED